MYDHTRSGHICGCYFNGASNVFYHPQRYYLPAVEIESHTKVTPIYFSTRLRQKFSNPHDKTIEELRYTFPLYDGVSVSAYTMQYGENTLKGVVKQKEVARQTYQAAVDRGETTGLLESLPAGVFGVTVGNLPAKTDVYVEITYLGELKHDAGIDGLRYTLPTAIAPRYGDYPGELLKSNVIGKGIKITVDIDMGKSAIRKVQSPTHPIAVSMGSVSTDSSASTFSPSLGSASLTQGSTELGDDFILQLLIDDISKPQAILEHHTELNTRAIMTTLVPKFNLPLSTPEICFIADQSGSMSGSKNAELVAALHIFLKSLPFGVRFNICAFGDHYTYLWPKSQAYNEENFEKASKFVNTFRAQYGGTKIYEPIEQAFLRRHGDLPLEIMLLTDGEIWEEQALFELINSKLHTDGVDARVFTLGIGSDVSHTLCEGVARAGNGFAQFVVQNEETDAKTLRMLRASLFPHTKDYSLEINFDDREDATDDFEIVEKITNQLHIEETATESEPKEPKASSISFFNTDAETDLPTQTKDRYAHLPNITVPSVLQAPSRIPPLFPYNRTNLYFILDPNAPQKEVVSVTLRARAPSGPLELTIPVYVSTPGTIVHQLAARKTVQELEEGRGWIQEGKTDDGWEVKKKYESRLDELVEREAVRLGEAYQVAGKWCSFVAVSANDTHAEPLDAKVASLHDTTNRFVPFGTAASSVGPPAYAMAVPPPSAPATKYGALSSLFGGADARHSGVARSSATSLFSMGVNASRPAPPGFVQPQFQMDCAAQMPLGSDEDEDDDEDMGFALCDDFNDHAPQVEPAASDKDIDVDSKNAAAVLRAVINLQTFPGYWRWDEKLMRLIGSPEYDSKQDETSATTLVLAYFEIKMLAQRDVWEMVAQKAQAWLQSQVPSAELDKLMEVARGSFS
ncbi:hypothetical protein AMS68_003543 [Peltaster fructicola]|uniref:VIT domain-containing protein n=1 Tax=Peltaster fructicola TaxID=286661 RepID=A0A6H0XTM4_9PEZI|nr:hypothetical protein AMS68_003543 [Peltaster fructicola]